MSIDSHSLRPYHPLLMGDGSSNPIRNIQTPIAIVTCTKPGISQLGLAVVSLTEFGFIPQFHRAWLQGHLDKTLNPQPDIVTFQATQTPKP